MFLNVCTRCYPIKLQGYGHTVQSKQICTYTHIHIYTYIKNLQFELLVWGSHSHQLYHHAGSPPTDGEQCKGFQIENCVWGHHIHNSYVNFNIGGSTAVLFQWGITVVRHVPRKIPTVCSLFLHRTYVRVWGFILHAVSISRLHLLLKGLRVKPSLEEFDSLV